MEAKNIILIIIAILIIALVGVGLFVLDNGHNASGIQNITSNLNLTPNNDNATNATAANITNKTNEVAKNATNATNATKIVGDHSLRNTNVSNNTTAKVYNPQSDSYVPVVGEKYDEEVHRWYTYDADGVRYYNTRINH